MRPTGLAGRRDRTDRVRSTYDNTAKHLVRVDTDQAGAFRKKEQLERRRGWRSVWAKMPVKGIEIGALLP